MNKVTIILGPQGSGKTTLAKKLINGRKFFALTSKPIKDSTFYSMDNDVEVILIEENFNLRSFMQLAYCEKIIIHKQSEKASLIKRPELIFTSNFYRPIDFLPFSTREYVEVIKLDEIKTFELTIKETATGIDIVTGETTLSITNKMLVKTFIEKLAFAIHFSSTREQDKENAEIRKELEKLRKHIKETFRTHEVVALDDYRKSNLSNIDRFFNPEK